MRLDVLPAAERTEWRRISRLDQLQGDGPFALAVREIDVAVVRGPTGWIALSGLCPHQGALLGEGELDDGELVCRNHGWRFEVATGSRVGGPQCLARFPLKEEDGWLWVDVGSARASAKATEHGYADSGARRRFDDLPGPRGRPFVGNALQVDPTALHLTLERWADEHGPTYGFRIGKRRVIALLDPTLGAQALKARPEKFRRPSNLEIVFREMGVDGVFSAEGAAWRPQRQLAMRALAARNLRRFYGTLAEVTKSLHVRWSRAADESRVLDVQEEMMRFTVDATTALVFGHNVRSIEDREDQLQRDLDPIFPAFSRRLFGIFPYWRYFRLAQDREVDRALASVREWIAGVIEETRKRLEADPELRAQPENFMEAMLTATDENGDPFTDDIIYGNAMTMLLAGEDTTANTLAWAVHHLCDSPEAVAELRRELDATMGDEDLPPDLDAARGLRFTSAIADEAMRLRPVAPMIFLEAAKYVVLGDLEIERGTEIVLLNRLAVRDPALVEDPDTFRPERWLDADFVSAIRAAHAHVPFGSGPRICPGRSLALLEMQLVLAMLYRSFSVERVGGSTDVKEHLAFTLEPRGLRVRLRHRTPG